MKFRFLFLTFFASQQIYAAETEKVRKHLSDVISNYFHSDSTKSGSIKHFELTAKKSKVTLHPEVSFEAWSYNGKIPGETIRVKLGDTVQVKFKNELPSETTIHWHGVRVPNAMDGVPGVNQKPVPPGGEFTYRFKPKEAGTFLYDPHVRGHEQLERGLSGVLIVEDENSEKYSKDIVLVIDDWRINKGGKLSERFMGHHDLMHDGRWGNLITVNGKYQPDIEISPGDRIRIRMINVSNARIYRPKFKGVAPKVVSYDGLMVGSNKIQLDKLFLAPGNRIDLDIEIPKSQKTALQLIDSFTRNEIPLAKFALSKTLNKKTPSFALRTTNSFPDTSQAKSLPTDFHYTLEAKRGGKYGISWTMNEKAWGEHDIFKLKKGRYYKLLIENKSSRLHPMHFHGLFFQVLSRNKKFQPELFWRDTALILPRESIEIGLVALDLGKWVNHCHILEHAESGMMSMIEVHD